MKMLGEQSNSIFLGQAVACEGTAMFRTLADVPMSKRLEMPVVEDMQMGMATGLALGGKLPICIYPRFNFLLLAINQLVLHLDKLPMMGGYRPKVLIRTAIATEDPLYPGPQHLGDFVTAFSYLLSTIMIEKLERSDDILPAYDRALRRDGSTLLVEMSEKYVS